MKALEIILENKAVQFFIVMFSFAIVIISIGFAFYLSGEFKHEFDIKLNDGTYEIYRNNELEFEFHKKNTDSLSLETLKLIYEGD